MTCARVKVVADYSPTGAQDQATTFLTGLSVNARVGTMQVSTVLVQARSPSAAEVVITTILIAYSDD